MFIDIKNFGMIESAKMQLDGLTVIAGENNTGKSTIGKLIFSIVKSHTKSPRLQRRLREGFRPTPLLKLAHLVFEMDMFTSTDTNISMIQNNQTYYSILSNGQGGIHVDDNLDQLHEAIYIESPVVWSLIDFFSTVGLLQEEDQIFGGMPEEIKYPYLLWDTYKKLISPFRMHTESQQEYTQQCKQLEELIQKVIGGRIQNDHRTFSFHRDLDNAVFSVTNIATGIKSFGILQVLIRKRLINSNTILIIDEPEVHLHPEWELRFAEVIAGLVRFGVRVVVTTHSMYMVRALREYTKHESEKVRFYLAESNDKLHSTYTDVTMDIQRIYKKFADPLSKLVWGDIDV